MFKKKWKLIKNCWNYWHLGENLIKMGKKYGKLVKRSWQMSDNWPETWKKSIEFIENKIAKNLQKVDQKTWENWKIKHVKNDQKY